MTSKMEEVQIRAVKLFCRFAGQDGRTPHLVLSSGVYPIAPVPPLWVGRPEKFSPNVELCRTLFGEEIRSVEFCPPCFCKSPYPLLIEEYLDKYEATPPKFLSYNIWWMAYRYWRERRKWLKAGQPMRSAEEILDLFGVCTGCPFYEEETPEAGSCSLCGCSLKREGADMNKLAWATTRCPHPAPRWF